MPKKYAASEAGISEATYYNWMSKAQEIDTEEPTETEKLFLMLIEYCERACAGYVKDAIKRITAEAGGDKWMLSKLDRKQFGDHIEIETELPNMIQLIMPGIAKTPEEKEEDFLIIEGN